MVELADGMALDLAGVKLVGRPRAGAHAGLGDVPAAGARPSRARCSPATCCSPGRSAEPTCPAATTRRSWIAWPGSACRCPTRPWCCPGTGRRRRSAPSGRSNPFLAGLGPARSAGAVTAGCREHGRPTRPVSLDLDCRQKGWGAMIRTHEAGALRAARRGPAGHAGRLGGAAPGPRRRGLHRPARRQRRRPGGAARRRTSRTSCGPSSACWSPARCGSRPAGNENPELPTGEIEVAAERDRGAVRVRPAAVPGRGRRRAERGGAAAVPVPGHQAGRDGGRAAGPVQGGLPGQRRDARARVRQRGDAVPDQVDAGGRARLPGAGPAAARAAGTRCRSRRSCSSSC